MTSEVEIVQYITLMGMKWVSVKKKSTGKLPNFELIDLFLIFFGPPSLTTYRIFKNRQRETD